MANLTERIIQPAPSSLKARVWAHFGFYNLEGKTELDRNHAICRLCKAKVKYFGNTTNLRTHMVRHHPEINIKDVDEQQPKVPNMPVNQRALSML